MSDVELIIKISEETYKDIQSRDWKNGDIYSEEWKAIHNGTPLPKGHGRIMDVDKVIKKMEEREEKLKDNRSIWETSAVETALDMFGETIIPADKE